MPSNSETVIPLHIASWMAFSVVETLTIGRVGNVESLEEGRAWFCSVDARRSQVALLETGTAECGRLS